MIHDETRYIKVHLQKVITCNNIPIENLQAKKEHSPVFIGKYIPEKLQFGARKLIRKEQKFS